MAISLNQTSSTLSFIERINQERQQQAEKLASAKRINSAADDAAGLQIADRLTAQVNQLEQAGRNAQDNIGINNVQESKLQAISDGLQRASVLTVQAGNPLNSSSAIQDEFNQIADQINVLAEDALGQSNFLSGLDATDPATSQAAIETAFSTIADKMSQLGAGSNALTSQINSFEVARVNTSESRSRIQDTDFAKVTSEQEQDNVLLRAAILTKKDEEARKGLLINKLV